ncbi:ATP-binding protein [Streptomyces sp. NPDC054956]
MTESGTPDQSANVNESSYNADHIVALQGREAIRKRPGMYIGSCGERGLSHMVFEVVAHCVDEYLAGHADTVDVTIAADGGIRVTDNGRGIPIECEESTGEPTVEPALTALSYGAGRKSGYWVSGGMSGLGLCVVNALSGRLTVEIRRDGYRWTQEYEEGIPLGSLTRREETAEHGTTLTFWADAGIFETTWYSFTALSERFRELASLNPGLAVSLTDERPARAVRYDHAEGVRDFVTHLNSRPPRTGTQAHPSVIGFASENADRTMAVQVGLQWTTSWREEILSFANTARTLEGGSHEEGLRTALTALLSTWARRRGLLADDDGDFVREDVHKGLTAVVSVKLTHPRFEGATKTKLAHPGVDAYVQEVVRENLAAWLEENPLEAEDIVRTILDTAAARRAN